MDKKNFELAVQLRHELHQHPELSNEEVWTKKHLMEFLKKNTKNIKLVDKGHWFYGVYHGRDGKRNIGYRADFDAIPTEDAIDVPYKSQFPGVGHKCGHDGHSATLAAFALEVDQFGAENNIYFLFQHAEEIGDGAKYCAAIIDECKIDEFFAFHNKSKVPRGAVVFREGTQCCASKGMEIKFTGVPAHASTPENGKNPALAIASIISEIPKFIDPEKNKGIVLATVIQVDLGERAFGCAASKGNLLLTIRAEYEKEMDQLQEKLEKLAHQEAEKYGLICKFEFYDEFPETVNHKSSCDKIRKVSKELGLQVVEMEKPERGSEDFGYFTKTIPGAIFNIGNGEEYPPVHDEKFDFIDAEIQETVEIFKRLEKA